MPTSPLKPRISRQKFQLGFAPALDRHQIVTAGKEERGKTAKGGWWHMRAGKSESVSEREGKKEIKQRTLEQKRRWEATRQIYAQKRTADVVAAIRFKNGGKQEREAESFCNSVSSEAGEVVTRAGGAR